MERDTACDNQAPFVIRNITALAHAVAETYQQHNAVLCDVSFSSLLCAQCCVSCSYLFIVGIMKMMAVILLREKVQLQMAAL